jgi:CubicO group peptidase (beta-lactamase class C family)
MVAATPWPLRALAQSASGHDLATEWPALAQRQLDTGKPSAVAYNVVRPEGVIANGLGHLSKQSDAPDADSTTIFEIGSTTKVFTAILLGLTVDPSFGVTLDTKLGPFLRELPEEIRNKKVERLSFGELAQYASCLTTDPPGHDNPDYTLQDLAEWLNGPDVLQHPCQPGKVYYYSNIAWGLLGYALAQVWQYPSWTELVRDQLAMPLGMPDTIRSGTQTDAQKLRTATGYDEQDHEAPPLLGAPFLGGGGELVSTAADMVRFIQVNIDPSQAPTPALQQAIRFTQSSLKTYKRGIPEGSKPPPRKLKATVSSGIGWFAGITKDGAIGWTKNGGTQGFESFVGFLPSTRQGIFMVLNHQGFNPQTDGRADLGLDPLDADPG